MVVMDKHKNDDIYGALGRHVPQGNREAMRHLLQLTYRGTGLFFEPPKASSNQVQGSTLLRKYGSTYLKAYHAPGATLQRKYFAGETNSDANKEKAMQFLCDMDGHSVKIAHKHYVTSNPTQDAMVAKAIFRNFAGEPAEWPSAEECASAEDECRKRIRVNFFCRARQSRDCADGGDAADDDASEGGDGNTEEEADIPQHMKSLRAMRRLSAMELLDDSSDEVPQPEIEDASCENEGDVSLITLARASKAIELNRAQDKLAQSILSDGGSSGGPSAPELAAVEEYLVAKDENGANDAEKGAAELAEKSQYFGGCGNCLFFERGVSGRCPSCGDMELEAVSQAEVDAYLEAHATNAGVDGDVPGDRHAKRGYVYDKRRGKFAANEVVNPRYITHAPPKALKQTHLKATLKGVSYAASDANAEPSANQYESGEAHPRARSSKAASNSNYIAADVKMRSRLSRQLTRASTPGPAPRTKSEHSESQNADNDVTERLNSLTLKKVATTRSAQNKMGTPKEKTTSSRNASVKKQALILKTGKRGVKNDKLKKCKR